MVVGKVVAYWLMTGLPLALLAPLLALQFYLPTTSILILATTLLIGTPVLALIGSIGASLTLGLRGGGVLIALLVLPLRSEEHTSELQSRGHLVCRLLLEKKKKKKSGRRINQ